MNRERLFQTLLLLAALLFGLLDLTEGAKGSLVGGVMSRTNMRRIRDKYYVSGEICTDLCTEEVKEIREEYETPLQRL